jgi:hypothetical protein
VNGRGKHAKGQGNGAGDQAWCEVGVHGDSPVFSMAAICWPRQNLTWKRAINQGSKGKRASQYRGSCDPYIARRCRRKPGTLDLFAWELP